MSEKTQLVILGAGYAYWEIFDLVLDINAKGEEQFEIIAALDDNQAQWGKDFDGVPVDGPLEKAHEFAEDVKFVLAIGSHRTLSLRHQIIKRLALPLERFQTLIHPTAKVFSTAIVGPGCIIHYGSVIFSLSVLKPFVIVSANCVVAVKNLIGTGAMLGSTITLTTGVRIGSYAFVGSSTSIAENIEIGPCAKVGMTSNVFKRVKPGVTIFGHPSKFLGKIEVEQEILDLWEKEKEEEQD